jgi:enoyl-[acyl-carrier protein] reductase/trans-2-enoyl-CoA reductase (NAD+)
MVIIPKVRGFICTAAHPEGCAKNVASQISYVNTHGKIEGAKNVLIIGASTGYGLASRIVASFGCGANTIGVFFEKAAEGKRTASAGWYNSAAFENEATKAGYYAKSLNGDAFSNELKEKTIALIKKDLKKIDLIIYSLASPRRTDPVTGETYSSSLKTVGKTFNSKTVDPIKGIVKEVSIDPAEQKDIDNTIKVMGGEDWELWIEALSQAEVLNADAMTVAYSYVGPELTYPVYKNGTIGKAKDHLLETANKLNKKLAKQGGKAFVSINKAVVTQASSAIPVVPLYISILFKLMKEKGSHEGCIEQIYRLFKDFLYNTTGIPVDEQNRIRVDDLEMDPEIQKNISSAWQDITTENLETLTDVNGYRQSFYQLFGFKVPEVDYEKEVDAKVDIPSVHQAGER